MPAPLMAILSFALIVVSVLAAVGVYVYYQPDPEIDGQVPAREILARAARCNHRKPTRPYTIDEAWQVMQDLGYCNGASCPDKGAAYWTLAHAGKIVPDVRVEWGIGR